MSWTPSSLESMSSESLVLSSTGVAILANSDNNDNNDNNKDNDLEPFLETGTADGVAAFAGDFAVLAEFGVGFFDFLATSATNSR